MPRTWSSSVLRCRAQPVQPGRGPAARRADVSRDKPAPRQTTRAGISATWAKGIGGAELGARPRLAGGLAVMASRGAWAKYSHTPAA